MKSVFLSILLILSLVTQVFSMEVNAGSGDDKNSHVLVSDQYNAAITETRFVCCDEDEKKQPVVSTCTIDCKFFAVTITLYFPDTDDEHAGSGTLWFANIPTIRHLRPPIS